MRRKFLWVVSIVLSLSIGFWWGAEYGQQYGINQAPSGLGMPPFPDYSGELTNALIFRNEARRHHGTLAGFLTGDSAKDRFIKRVVRVLREDSAGYEALSLPRTPLDGQYYLIRNDSIYQMTPRVVLFQTK